MQTANIQNVAGSCSTSCSKAASTLNWVGQNLKVAGTSALDGLKKAAFYVSCFFAKMGKYLYQGALLVKGAVMHGLILVKSYVSHHPREIKIAAVAGGVGALLAALITYACTRSSSTGQPAAVYENIVINEKIASPKGRLVNV